MDRVDFGPVGEAEEGHPFMSKATLAASALVKSFSQTRALQGVDFSIGRGEVVAVMGPSGSGKSTLLHCLAGILVPDEGEVYFDGQRIDLLNEERRSLLRRTDFGFVFQFGQLIPELPAKENIILPLLLSGVPRRNAVRRAAVWFDRLGIADVAEQLPGDMSGGQAQRVALARALVIDPEVIFADEPTGSLDSLTGELVMELLLSCTRENNVAVVLVTHEPRVAAYADREVVLRDGRVAKTAVAS